ncbi:hypothetical protein POM88_016811 [Heracleum sosnowskyi]|uniref:Transposase n=1 Tax=Heracleum sosnowskyi TaxID=360622 RepID=A0AAD8IPN6_9APIA|nr:hypothetical protein POM88_016811 [Heracleum sosnowskyi]
MAPRKEKGKSKEPASKGSTNGRVGSSTRSSTRGRLRTPSPTPPEERAWRGRKPRSNSMGKFGEKRPRKPIRVDIHGGRIFDDTAKKTLLAIIRDQWPTGLYTYTNIASKNPGWMEAVIAEFKCLYKNLRGQSRFQATWSINQHVKRTCKRVMNEEKDRLKKNIGETGLPSTDLWPSYFHPILWDELLKYWDSEGHKHRSNVGAKNREKVQTLHSAGAKAFEAEMTKANKGKKPKRLQLWDRTHTTAASRRANKGKVYTTPEAMAIASRYGAILEREGVDLTSEIDMTEPMQWWLQATTNGADKPKKNHIIGFPSVPANTLLPNLAHRFREGTRGGASSSSSAPNRPPNIPDQLFVQVVRNVVTAAQANPGYFQRQLDNEELEGLARNLIDVADPDSRGNLNTVFFREVVNVVATVMTDICNKYEAETQAAIEEANQEFIDGESSEYGESEGEDGEDRATGADRENDRGDAEI